MYSTAELVSQIRHATGDTQESLARRLGVSFPTVNSWERGRSEPHAARRRELEELAADVGVRAELRVLVIDDDPVTVELVRAAAADIPAATIDFALGGWEGLVKCGSIRPQLLFLDVMMPGIDGLEVARRLPTIGGLEDTRIVFVTASQSPEVLASATALGSAVLAKPLELDDLAAAMRSLLDGERPS